MPRHHNFRETANIVLNCLNKGEFIELPKHKKYEVLVVIAGLKNRRYTLQTRQKTIKITRIR